jgi:hypothetical protein
MKLDMLSDKLDEIHVARKYKRLSTAVVCSHLLSSNFGNNSTYLGNMFVLCIQRSKDCCGEKQKRYLSIAIYISYIAGLFEMKSNL